MKNPRILIFVWALFTGWLLMTSCDREIEPRPNFPEVNLFSPEYVSSGDTLVIVGKNLAGATVAIDGVELAQKYVSDDETQIVLNITSSNKSGSVEVTTRDGKKLVFSQTLKVNEATRPTYHTLLVGDFDGGGIRQAEATNDFGSTAWGINSSAAAVTGIGGLNNISSSPAGGNYVFITAAAAGILPVTEGFVATLDSRNEVNGDGTVFPASFFEYPGSVVPFPDTTGTLVPDWEDYYLKFYVNFNEFKVSRLRMFLVDESNLKPGRLAYTIDYRSTRKELEASDPAYYCGTAVNETNEEVYTGANWIEFVVPLSSMADNFGFGNGLVQEDPPGTAYLSNFNKLSFDITDYYDSSDSLRFNNADDPKDVQVYLDHFEIIYAPSVADGSELLDTPIPYFYTVRPDCVPNIGPSWFQVH